MFRVFTATSIVLMLATIAWAQPGYGQGRGQGRRLHAGQCPMATGQTQAAPTTQPADAQPAPQCPRQPAGQPGNVCPGRGRVCDGSGPHGAAFRNRGSGQHGHCGLGRGAGQGGGGYGRRWGGRGCGLTPS